MEPMVAAAETLQMELSDLGCVIQVLKQGGYRAWRKGWNATNQFIYYQKGYPEGIPINKNTAEATGIAEGTVCGFRPYLTMKTVQNDFVPWLPSQSDLLADDWMVERV